MPCNDSSSALSIAVAALERIADEKQTSLRWRSRTFGGAVEKPNVRIVAEEALQDIAALPGTEKP